MVKQRGTAGIGYNRIVEIIADGADWLKRRDQLFRLQPRCPKCNHEQVQLVSYFVVPARWRCRMCKHKFELG